VYTFRLLLLRGSVAPLIKSQILLTYRPRITWMRWRHQVPERGFQDDAPAPPSPIRVLLFRVLDHFSRCAIQQSIDR
jgi:hypothetical protein